MSKMLLRAGFAALLSLALVPPSARADYVGTQAGGGANITYGAFAPTINGVVTQLTKSVPVDPVSGQAIFTATAPGVVSGTVSTNLLIGGAAVASGNPIPVSQATVPTGAATSALQNTIIANQSVTAPGTSATTGQGVQGVTGGVPLATTIRSAGTNRSAAVTTTASTLMAANTARQGWKIKNDCTVAVWVNFDATATAVAGGGNIQVASGGYLASEPGFIETGAMSAISTSGTCNLTAREY